MNKPKSHIHAERMLAALAESPMMSTGELTKILNITSVECSNALRRLAGQLDITVVSPKVRRFKLKPNIAKKVVVLSKPARRESIPMHALAPYTGEKPTHRVSL